MISSSHPHSSRATTRFTKSAGEPATRGGACNPKTIRYYEAIGLLPGPPRTASGYRRYDEAAVSLVGFIQRAKRLGLSLEEIRDVLAIQERGERPCEHVLALVDAGLARIELRIRELRSFRAELLTLRSQWSDEAKRRADPACVCPIIEEQTTVITRAARNLNPEPSRRPGRVAVAGRDTP